MELKPRCRPRAAAAFASLTQWLSVALGAGVSDLALLADPPIEALAVGP